MTRKKILLNEIVVPADLGGLRLNEDVSDIIGSIKECGLLNPLIINSQNRLIAGGRRYTAIKQLGWNEVDVLVINLTPIDEEIAAIDENLARKDLEPPERDRALARRKKLYEQKYPNTKHGVAGAIAAHLDDRTEKNATADSATAHTPSFVKDTANKTGMAERTVRQGIARAEKASPKVNELWESKQLSQSHVDEICKLPLKQQEELAPHAVGKEVMKVRAAVKVAMDSNTDAAAKTLSSKTGYQRNSLDAHISSLSEKIIKALKKAEEASVSIFSIKSLRVLYEELVPYYEQQSKKAIVTDSAKGLPIHKDTEGNTTEARDVLLNRNFKATSEVPPFFSNNRYVHDAAIYLEPNVLQEWAAIQVCRKGPTCKWYHSRLKEFGQFFETNPSVVSENERSEFIKRTLKVVHKKFRKGHSSKELLKRELEKYASKNISGNTPLRVTHG